MIAYLAGLPTWVFVVAGIVLGYILYRYWKYKKSIAYAPRIARGSGGNFTTPRDNPPSGTG